MAGKGEMDDNLLHELECPVCKEYMEPPIVLCNNGHSVCKNCRPRLAQCPTCRSQISSIRNIALENIARFSLYPCRNRDHGCHEIFNMEAKNKHESECPYKQYPCPFAKLCKQNCAWKGFLGCFTKHIATSHGSPKDICTASGSIELNFKEFSHGSAGYGGVIICMDESFFLLARVMNKTFLVTLIYLGTREMSLNYKYRFSLYSQDGEELVHFCQRVQNYFVDGDKILMPDNCIVLHEGTVKKFLNTVSDLKGEIQIYNVDAGLMVGLKKDEASGGEMVRFSPGRTTENYPPNPSNSSNAGSSMYHRRTSQYSQAQRPVRFQTTDMPNEAWGDESIQWG